MDKKELNKKLNDVKKKIKANSKDAHFAEALIDEALSLKGQLGIEPTIVHIPTEDVVRTLKGDTFEMSVTKHGDAIYHVYGGYTLIADGQRMRSLANTIADYIINQDLVKDLDDKEKELYDLDLSATAYVLNIPMIAFSDADLKYDLASKIVTWLRETYEKAMEQPLQEETRERDAAFENAAKAIEDVKKSVKE
jgi:hypothetical protein